MTVEVNPMSKAELDFADYKKVPVATIDGQEVCHWSPQLPLVAINNIVTIIYYSCIVV